MKIEDLTNEEKIEILEAMKKEIKDRYVSGLCTALVNAVLQLGINKHVTLAILGLFKTDYRTSLDFPYWWPPYKSAPRIKAIDEAIHRIKFEITTRELNEKEAEKGNIIYRN